MARKVLTVRELESVGQGGELVVAFGTIITPLARDEAEAPARSRTRLGILILAVVVVVVIIAILAVTLG